MSASVPRYCPAPGCDRRIAGALFACRTHWYALPEDIRGEIWATYRKRQRTRGPYRPTAIAEHRAAMLAAVEWFEENLAVAE